MSVESNPWQDLSNVERPMVPGYKMPTIGLALGGGVSRGFAHIGVIRALRRHGIKPDVVSGTSIGAVVGGCYLAKKLDLFEEWARGLSRDGLFSYLDVKMRSPSIIGGKKFRAPLDEHLKDLKIEELPHPFIVIATDIVTGHEVWIRRGHLVDAMNASFALPGIFPPMQLDGRNLIDGALVNPVPVSACRAMGARLVIAVDLNSDLISKAKSPGKNYQNVMGFDIFGDQGVKNQSMFNASNIARRLFRRDPDQPSLFGVMFSTLNIVLDRITRSRLAGDPPDIHIKPLIGHIGLLEFERVDELIREGEAAVERILPDIKAAVRALLPEKADEILGTSTNPRSGRHYSESTD